MRLAKIRNSWLNSTMAPKLKTALTNVAIYAGIALMLAVGVATMVGFVMLPVATDGPGQVQHSE